MPYNCFGILDICKGNDRIGQREAEEICTDNVRVFSYNSLRSATDGFHPTNRIGGGGFGVVFKGVLRDGTQVAVKSLSAESKQGTREFLTEINLISNIQHPNLVNLIGCCVEGNNRILVYEYLENNSLASVLLGSRSKYVWKLREEGRLLDGVDPDLAKFPEDEVTRFIKVALFCTQAAAQKRPNMKQVVEMLCRKEINLNEAALTEPGVYRGVNRGRNHRGLGLGGGSSQEGSSTQGYKGKSSAIPQGSSSASVISFQSITEMAPR
ncbi:unnamed protein product [Thlaspi arvense]|uniref:Protein kinase domain-containing protein n=1 Tax=Thlaspi arvense TaxID=13288 RepID=A0AAU9S1Q4_THLAR|nr:unnamed protein product [Thlaspi arvense]